MGVSEEKEVKSVDEDFCSRVEAEDDLQSILEVVFTSGVATLILP